MLNRKGPKVESNIAFASHIPYLTVIDITCSQLFNDEDSQWITWITRRPIGSSPYHLFQFHLHVHSTHSRRCSPNSSKVQTSLHYFICQIMLTQESFFFGQLLTQESRSPVQTCVYTPLVPITIRDNQLFYTYK